MWILSWASSPYTELKATPALLKVERGRLRDFRLLLMSYALSLHPIWPDSYQDQDSRVRFIVDLVGHTYDLGLRLGHSFKFLNSSAQAIFIRLSVLCLLLNVMRCPQAREFARAVERSRPCSSG